MSAQQAAREQIKPVASRDDSSGNNGGDTGDLPASLLKRVAQAADGFRNGRRVWFVVERAFPHAIATFFQEAEAKAAVDDNGESHVLVGPYRTPVGPSSMDRVEWIDVKLAGREKPLRYNGESVDALFFSQSALDKFFYPYYTAVYGPEYAAEMRKRHTGASTLSVDAMELDAAGGATQAMSLRATNGSGGPPVCHEPASTECNSNVES